MPIMTNALYEIIVMANDFSVNNKLKGIYYTPKGLAEFLVRPLIDRSNLTIFDPAFGEGSLLLSAEKIFNATKGRTNGNLKLFGCDIHPVNGLLEHLPISNLLALDFFEYPMTNKFDVILMNPPYIRHHLIGRTKIEKYQKLISNICHLDSKSDLWTYFLVKSIAHLKKGGGVGAILPWSFLQADYSRNIRIWLSEIFGKITVLALGAEYFNNAKERVVLVWLKDYGKPCQSVKIDFSKRINDNIKYENIVVDQWVSDKVVFHRNDDSESIISSYVHDFGFSTFDNWADVKIGVVTGADYYFILSDTSAREIGASKKHLIRIYTNSKGFRGFYNNGLTPPNELLVLNKANAHKYDEYIKKGEEKGYHLRSHSLRRNPWYSVTIGETPDAFFPYRISNLPYLIRNDGKAQSTNSVHRIYFKNLSETETKWIQVSLLSVPGQLSIERESKTYGRGMLKIEPKSLKNSIVYKAETKKIERVYNAVNKLLLKKDKVGAMNLATNFINKELGVPQNLSRTAMSALLELQTRRLDR